MIQTDQIACNGAIRLIFSAHRCVLMHFTMQSNSFSRGHILVAVHHIASRADAISKHLADTNRWHCINAYCCTFSDAIVTDRPSLQILV
jgi:hypothetical protein